MLRRCLALLSVRLVWALAFNSMAANPTSRIPVEFLEGLIWVKVHDSIRCQSLQFLLDSGASHSVLDHRTAIGLGLPMGSAVAVRGVGSTATGYAPIPWQARLGDVALTNHFLVLDLSSLSKTCGRQVDGLIGADFFRNRIVEIDYGSRELRLLDESPPHDDSRAVPMAMGPRGVSILGSVNGSRHQPLRVDTGCATALHWVSETTSSRACPGPPSTGLSAVSIRQTLAGIRLGPHHLDTIPTGIHRKPIFAGEAGLLGNGLLAMFGVVTFDSRSQLLHLGPRQSRQGGANRTPTAE